MLSISRRIWIWILGFWTSRLDILLSFSLTLLYVLPKDKSQSEIFSESYSTGKHIPWKSWVQSTFVTTTLKKSLVSKHWGIPVLLWGHSLPFQGNWPFNMHTRSSSFQLKWEYNSFHVNFLLQNSYDLCFSEYKYVGTEHIDHCARGCAFSTQQLVCHVTNNLLIEGKGF